MVLKDSDVMSLNVSNVTFSRTTISPNSVVEIQSGTTNQNLGRVEGTGAIRVLSNNNDAALPAGDYADFFTDCATGGGALEYGGTGNYTILNETNEVKSLLLLGGGNKTMASKNINICDDYTIDAGTINFSNNNIVTVNRDFILNSGTANLGESGTVDIKNDINFSGGTINGAFGTTLNLEGNIGRTSTNIDMDDATLVMAGAAQQEITGDFTGSNDLGSLTINNDAGVLLNDDVEIATTLNLTDGIITTSKPTLEAPISTAGAELLLSTTSILAASDTSYVEGIVTVKNLGTSENINLPTGDNGFLAQISVSNPTTVTDWTARYVNSDPQNVSNNIRFGPPETISDKEYWVLNGSGAATIGITYGPQSGVVDPTGLAIARLDDVTGDGNFDNNDEWIQLDINNSSTDPNQGTLSTTSKQSFSTVVFTAGEQQDDTLPVELTSFEAREKEEGALLKWETATEKENFGFFLERSEPLKDATTDTSWQEIGFVEGAGTTLQPQFYEYLDREVDIAGDYQYRIIQIDFDGEKTALGTVDISISAPEKFKLNQNYPNPFNPTTTIPYKVPRQSNVKLIVYNLLGQEVATLVDGIKQAGSYEARFDASRLSSGLYLVRFLADGNAFTRKLMLVK